MQKAEIKYICSDGGIGTAEYVVVTLIFRNFDISEGGFAFTCAACQKMEVPL